MRTNVLEVENLIRNYRKSVIKESEEDVKVLKGISFQVTEGEFVGIMGKSGCGKTTLLKTLGMIDKPTDGTIKFMGEDTSELYGDKLADIRNSKIGFIFQDFYLMDSLSVEENIMLPMIISKQNINKMIAEAKKYAEQFQIEHLLKKNPYELSGGEKQRVAICRALINNPDLILADEPTGNLDSKSGKIVIDALNKISSEYKKTIVMVTHDPQMATTAVNTVVTARFNGLTKQFPFLWFNEMGGDSWVAISLSDYNKIYNKNESLNKNEIIRIWRKEGSRKSDLSDKQHRKIKSIALILDEADVQESKKKCEEMAEKFAIADLLDKKPYELSGGEKQRTAICRALIYNPDLILADEPTGNLDSASSEVVIHTLEEINKKMGKTILLVTHDPIIASSCDRIIFLKDGKVKEDLKRTGDKEQFYNEIITNWC